MPSSAPFPQLLQQRSNSPPSNAISRRYRAADELEDGTYKVLSRQHAEVWEEGGKIYVKDVKSSNGSFIYGERLSSEGHELDPFELKSDDIIEFGIDIAGQDNKADIHHKVAARVEFGIDIAGQDNKADIHHKVAARVVCVFTEQDAQVAAWAKQH
ncbi:hypothetical protein CVT25_000146 [Psilocybe cyanescens]|uniref:FHA domain-containing protein n=1 Tax=Psilocybe cyanescens TaxID=93625 RepID=A0A409X8R7_PSICY|nr:hypothetical protein CVT25_000146 [Psilocybe cyanescens]